MRAARIANRMNLKSRAKAGRFLRTWERKLTAAARNLYVSGYQDALLAKEDHHSGQPQSPPPLPELVHSDAQSTGVDRLTSGGSLTPVPGEHL